MLASVDAIPTISPEIWRGELAYLALMSPTVHRLSLEMTDRQAGAIADAISDTTPVIRRSPGCKGSPSPACTSSSSATPASAATKGARGAQSGHRDQRPTA